MRTTSFGAKPVTVPTDHETVAMTIDDAGVEHLMSTMTNLYTDPVTAVLREYSANALDSHQKAGTKKPILISLPTMQHPFFVVRDFGVGLSKDELANVYSRYGASTKRDNNKQIGAFGLGAKSALAIADRFDIVSRKDGVVNNVYVEKNERGVGIFHFISAAPDPDNQNGVTITIPVKPNQVEAFRRSSHNFFIAWPSKSVLVDGVYPAGNIYDEGFHTIQSAGQIMGWVGEYGVANQPVNGMSYGITRLSFVVGGIRYNLPNEQVSKFKNLHDKITFFTGSGNPVYVNLPIGSVSLTPSRDELLFNDKTLKAIEIATLELMDLTPGYMKSHLNTLSLEDAYLFYAKNWATIVYDKDTVHYHGSGGRYHNSAAAPHSGRDYKVTWRGQPLLTEYLLPAKSTRELRSMKGSKLKDDVPYSKSLDFFSAARKTWNSGQAYYSSEKNVPHILVQTDNVLDKNDWGSLVRNIRDYASGVHESEAVVVVFTSVPITDDLKAVYTIATADEIAAGALQFRRDRRSKAQQGTTRAKPTYPVYETRGINAGNIPQRAETTSLMGNIVYFAEETTNSVYGNNIIWTTIRNGLVDGFSATTTFSLDSARILNTLFPASTIVFLTKGKSSDALLKKYPEAENAIDVIQGRLDAVLADPEKKKILTSIFSMKTSNNIARIVDTHGILPTVNNLFTYTVIESYLNEGELYTLSEVLRMFQVFNGSRQVKELHSFADEAVFYDFDEKFAPVLATHHGQKRGRVYTTSLSIALNAIDNHFYELAVASGLEK